MTERLGAMQLSDGGGPFGFDVTVALQVDLLIRAHECDGLVETGTFLGDTASYLARQYPRLPVRSIEVDRACAAVASRRLEGLANCEVLHGDSVQLLPEALEGFQCPLVYLDAHWGEVWPLHDELRSIRRGVVCVDDFNIGHPRFGFDIYDGVTCGAGLIAETLPDLEELYVGNPLADYEAPCLQVGRRSGTAFVFRDLRPNLPEGCDMFLKVRLDEGAPALPSWPSGVWHEETGQPDR